MSKMPQIGDMVHYMGLDSVHYIAIVSMVRPLEFKERLSGIKPSKTPPQPIRVMVIGLQSGTNEILFTDCEEDPNALALETWHWPEPAKAIPVVVP